MPLSEDVGSLIASAIPSVWTLEVLLLMHAAPQHAWSANELIRELRGSALVVANAIAALTAAGLVLEEAPGSFRYNPARPELGATVDRLAESYRATRFAVIQAILASPSDRIRSFADAFRLKKD